MSTSVEVSVRGEPKGQPRPRAFARNGMVRMYDPGTAEAWKGLIAAAWREQIPSPVTFEGPVALKVRFLMPRPKAHYWPAGKCTACKGKGEIQSLSGANLATCIQCGGTGKLGPQLRTEAPVWHTGKPDTDNLLKAVMDALTQLGVWKDDAQVCEVHSLKQYAAEPGAKITISVL